MMKQDISIWQVLFYLSMLVLTAWLILKVTGVIQTPLWLEYGVPVASLIIGVFAFYHNLIENINKLAVTIAMLSTKFDYLNIDIKELNLKVDHLGKKVDHLDNDVEFLKKRITA